LDFDIHDDELIDALLTMVKIFCDETLACKGHVYLREFSVIFLPNHHEADFEWGAG